MIIERTAYSLALKHRPESPLVDQSPLALVLPIIPHLLRREELGLLLIDARLAAVEVGRLGPHSLGLHDELVAEDHDEVERDPQVGSDEVLVVPFAVSARLVVRDEVVEALEEGDQTAEEEGDVRSPDSSRRDKRQGRIRDALCFASTNEVDVGDEDRDPCQDAKDCDEVDEVLEDGLR